ncbi:MAG: GNAT family N-acetyltransferase [Methanoregulaceae archaeon]|nr:GNAT family N-acetyltransferase [Methanoregulaceae archaeon]
MGFCIRTERLILEDLNEQDLVNLRQIANDPTVMQYVLLGLENDEQVAGFLQRGIDESGRDDRMAYVLAVRMPETGEFAGLTFLEIDPMLKSTAEVGCVLNKEYWGKGYASEILRKLLAFGFGGLSLHRIYGKCDELNHTSAGVMEKCGMKYEGTLREHVWLRDHWRSSRYFGILAGEFAACRSSSHQD